MRSDPLPLHGVLQRPDRTVVEHLRGVLAAAHQAADLLEAQSGVTEGDRLPLSLRELGDLSQQGAVPDPLLGAAGRVLLRDRLVLDRAAQLLAPAVGAEMIERRV